MSKFDKQRQGLADILETEDVPDVDTETLKRYLDYLKQNLEFPCQLTGIEDFPWEEYYVIGPGSKKEHERLRKTRPSYGDAEPDEHVIVFCRGEMTEIICPHQPQRHSTKKDVTRKRRSKGRTTKRSIPNEIKQQVEDIVKRFNKTEIRDPNRFYIPRYRGKFLYLDRDDYGFISHACRLEYTGDMNEWNFAIYKYSDSCYDPDEWLFPGDQHVDGSIEGAMKAGLKAYPD